MLLNRFHTVFGWTVQIPIGSDANPRSLRNFPCQANGAEMLRLACCLAMERGVSILAPIHDAVLVEGPGWEIDDTVAETQEAMAEASAVILDGFRLRSDAKIVRWPGRYMDDRGREFWDRVVQLSAAEFLDNPANHTSNISRLSSNAGSVLSNSSVLNLIRDDRNDWSSNVRPLMSIVGVKTNSG